jgi:hypothetical protein
MSKLVKNTRAKSPLKNDVLGEVMQEMYCELLQRYAKITFVYNLKQRYPFIFKDLHGWKNKTIDKQNPFSSGLILILNRLRQSPWKRSNIPGNYLSKMQICRKKIKTCSSRLLIYNGICNLTVSKIVLNSQLNQILRL